MASTSWNVGLNGNWATGGNWSAGVPNSGTDATINAFGTYSVTLTTNATVNSLTINAAGALLSQAAGTSLVTINAFNLDAGKAILRGTDVFGTGINQFGGVLQTANSQAMGTQTYTFGGGELLGLSSETFTNQTAMSGNIIFAAAHGMVLNQNASSWTFDATTPGSIRFGQGSNDGTVLWHTNSGSITNPGHVAVEVAGGTFQAGDDTWGFLFQNDSQTLVDSGATLDADGFDGDVTNLQGAGTVTNSNATTVTLGVLNGGNFSGVISGALALEVNTGTLVLSAAQTYTGGTTIDSGATLQLGTGGTAGAIVGNVADAGTLVYDHSGATTITAAITGAGGVTYEGGTGVTVNQAEGYAGTTTVIGEKATTNVGGGMGNGTLDLQNAELLVTTSQNMTLAHISIEGSSTIAAGHGRTLNMAAGASWALNGADAPATLNVGDGANDGTIVWMTGAGSTVIDLSQCSVEVHAGTLRAGDSSFDFLTENAQGGVAVDAGATLDLGQWGGGITDLSGAGSVTAHNSAQIEIVGGDFDGVISGAASLLVNDGVILTGNETFSQGTTIDTASALSLGNGGTTGSVIGNIVDNGTLIVDRSDAISEAVTISGSGQFIVAGTGTVTMDHSETYTGGTIVTGGELSIDRVAAISTGSLSVQGGEFLVTNNLTLTNQLFMSGNITIAAATGDQLNFNASTGWQLDATAPSSITFGDGTNNGAIVWHTSAGSSITNIENYSVDIHSATLKAGDVSLGFLLDDASNLAIDATGALNVNGFAIDVANLSGSGIISNTGTAATFSIETSNFSGHLNGALSEVQLFGPVTLSGTGNFAGNFQIESGAGLDMSGAWTQNMAFTNGSGFVVLHTPAQYSGHVTSTAAGDVIDVRGVDFNNASFGETYSATTGRVTLTDGTHTFHVTFDGSYVLGNFQASSDGHAGTDITIVATMEVPPTLASEAPDFSVF